LAADSQYQHSTTTDITHTHTHTHTYGDGREYNTLWHVCIHSLHFSRGFM